MRHFGESVFKFLLAKIAESGVIYRALMVAHETDRFSGHRHHLPWGPV